MGTASRSLALIPLSKGGQSHSRQLSPSHDGSLASSPPARAIATVSEASEGITSTTDLSMAWMIDHKMWFTMLPILTSTKGFQLLKTCKTDKVPLGIWGLEGEHCLLYIHMWESCCQQVFYILFVNSRYILWKLRYASGNRQILITDMTSNVIWDIISSYHVKRAHFL